MKNMAEHNFYTGKVILVFSILFLIKFFSLNAQTSICEDFEKFDKYFYNEINDSGEIYFQEIDPDLIERVLKDSIDLTNRPYFEAKYRQTINEEDDYYVIESHWQQLDGTRITGLYSSLYLLTFTENCDIKEFFKLCDGSFVGQSIKDSHILLRNRNTLKLNLYDIRYNEDGTEDIISIHCEIFTLSNKYIDTCRTERLYPEISTEIFPFDDLIKYSYRDLDIMRNEIFASHGYIFNSKKWIDYFSKQEWYKPSKNYSNDDLNDIELQNISTILKATEVKNNNVISTENN